MKEEVDRSELTHVEHQVLIEADLLRVDTTILHTYHGHSRTQGEAAHDGQREYEHGRAHRASVRSGTDRCEGELEIPDAAK